MPALRLLFLLATLLLTACHQPTGPKPFRVGMDLSYPPFEMRAETGAPSGVSVDLARALAQHLGQSVEIENMPFAGLLPALQTGKIDCILSSMTATEEKAKSVDFSEPYLRTGLCLLVGAKSNIHSAADLDQPGHKIAVVQATTGQTWAVQNLHQAETLVLAKETACVLEVVQGKADAFLYDQMSTLRSWLTHRESTRAILQPFREESWAVAFRKGDPRCAQTSTFIAAYRAAGGFDRLSEKWLHEQKAEFAKLGVPFVF